MTTVTIDGMDYDVRPLKRGEMKKLRAEGLLVTQLAGADDPDRADEAVDATLELLFGAEAVAAMESPTASRLFLAVVEATYGSVADEKNSLGSGDGTPTRSVSATAAPAAGPMS